MNPVAPILRRNSGRQQALRADCTRQAGPEFDEEKNCGTQVEIAIQVNGRIKATISIPKDMEKEEVLKQQRKRWEISFPATL